MSLNRLILYPKDPLFTGPPQPLLSILQQQQWIEASLPSSFGEYSYQVGERFFEAFLFLGCSPAIELSPTADGSPFCYLQLELEPQCQLVSGATLKAACKGCKQRYGTLPLLQSEAVPWVECSHCGSTYRADEIAWRKSAALSRMRLTLWNIFEGEAVPSDLLLGVLQRESGVAWSYAYVG